MPRRTLGYEEEPPSPARRQKVSAPTRVLNDAACLPWPSRDNAAIAVEPLEPGALVRLPPDGPLLTVASSLLEGHRFASRAIATGELLLSWGEPFGRALRPISPGEWLVNKEVLAVLHDRGLGTEVRHPNFENYVKPAVLNESSFVAGIRLPLTRASETFKGFVRPADRGAGTRNYLVLLALSSRVGAFARALEKRLRSLPDGAACEGFDGVVALPHTEDGSVATTAGAPAATAAANHEHLVRTLLGLIIHPNVGAAVVLQSSEDVAAAAAGRGVSYATIEAAASDIGHTDRLAGTPHIVRTLPLHEFGEELAAAADEAAKLLPALRRETRQSCAACALVVAQQCGGSDAFSGTAANPLLADASKLLIEAGGSALLAETDELIGAEQYVLQNVSDLATAKRFLSQVRRFRQYADDHHTSAEGNPSGGNMLRGLYNIALKSLGAAMKRHPLVRLERVIEYAERLPIPTQPDEANGEAVTPNAASSAFGGCVGAGYCFMDSPGNDLESIAGQVAAGCNVIYFSTGNGSITNFPFVPTIKVVSTSKRFTLMAADMDVDAGDVALAAEEKAERLFQMTLQVASGSRTRGETAGHYQLQIWRNWVAGRIEPPPALPPLAYPAAIALDGAASAARDSAAAAGAGNGALPMLLAPLAASASRQIELTSYNGLLVPHASAGDGAARCTSEHVALLLPTSLCSSEVARMLAAELQRKYDAAGRSIRFVSLPHTEGCGVSDEKVGAATLLGHLASPLVCHGLLLEHGCEKTHNDYFSKCLIDHGIDTKAFGWASLQADGGVAAVRAKVDEWFAPRLSSAPPPRCLAPLATLGVGLLVECAHFAAPGADHASSSSDESSRPLPDGVALCFARLTVQMAAQGLVVLPHTSALLHHPTFLETSLAEAPRPTLAYGQRLGFRPSARLLQPAPSEDAEAAGSSSTPTEAAPSAGGLHIMSMPTARWVETLSGVGASGVHMMLAWRAPGSPAPTGHPMIPMLSVALDESAGSAEETAAVPLADVLLPPAEGPVEWNQRVLRRMSEVASGTYTPLAMAHGNVDFQIARIASVSL